LKKILRKQVLSAREGLSAEERAKKSREIEERIFSLPEFMSARVVMFFASFRSEVETGPMIRHALTSGKRVVLPKVKDKELALFEIMDFDADVSPGAWGIPEPHESRPAKIETIDLIIVPGAAFDARGNRLGYGAGFYDKLLPAFKKMTVALAFEVQILPRVPVDAHDVPVKKIVTECRIINSKHESRNPK
jgi:5-formyltetrahydrofolate cyclo-ligase